MAWRIQAYSVLGGVPAYLLAFSGVDDLFEGIAERILTRGTFLYDEPRFRFRCRFVFPNHSDLEEGDARGVLERRIRPQFDGFVGPVFEEPAREWVRAVGRTDENVLGFRPHRVGSWWGREAELDVVALDEEAEHLAVGACKGSTHPVGLSVLRALEAKTTALLSDTRGLWRRLPQVRYLLFSRSGFTEELREQARKEPIRLVEARELGKGPA